MRLSMWFLRLDMPEPGKLILSMPSSEYILLADLAECVQIVYFPLTVRNQAIAVYSMSAPAVLTLEGLIELEQWACDLIAQHLGKQGGELQ